MSSPSIYRKADGYCARWPDGRFRFLTLMETVRWLAFGSKPKSYWRSA